ncbi:MULTISPECIES: hypothetical protein [Sphingobium]|jgi:hypothetical protein|uniref:Uncharacterized protein n=1 Tax=Sphingobium olei TaxID=420955 RepID=A0ABW3NWK8_9SPHN|nr:hypothetical protein [Sphingobium baderi]
MTDKTALRGRAVALMAEALDLLDRAGEDAAAIYLQQAHDIAARLTALRADDAADPDRRSRERATSLDPALVKAIGGALAVVSAFLEKSGVATTDDFAQALGIYATVSRGENEDEGLALAYWAATLRDVAEFNRREKG